MSRTVGCLFRGLDALGRKAKAPAADLPIESVSLSLRDLTGYLHPPDEQLEHEDRQNRLRALKNRQNLFQEEVRWSCRGAASVAARLAGRCRGAAGTRGSGQGPRQVPGRCCASLPPSVGSSALRQRGRHLLSAQPSLPSLVALSLMGLEGARRLAVQRGWSRAPGADTPGAAGHQAPRLRTDAPPLPFAGIKLPCVISFPRSAAARKSSSAVSHRIMDGPCDVSHGPHARVRTGPACSRGSVGGVTAELAGQARPAVSGSPRGPCMWNNSFLQVKISKKKGERTTVRSQTCVILCFSRFKTAS